MKGGTGEHAGDLLVRITFRIQVNLDLSIQMLFWYKLNKKI